MPLLVFLLLAVACLALLGFACACLTDHPAQALERVVAAIAQMPAVIEVWSLLTFAAGLALITAATRRRGYGPSRASPALLQRFLL